MKTKRIFKALAMAMLLTTATTAWAQSAIGSIQYNSTLGAYEIKSTDNLNDLAVYVNGKGEYSTGGASNAHDCSGKIFKQTADITYSHSTDWDNASSTENNYTPIGGYFSGDRFFKGTYDGQGHTISGIRRFKGGASSSDENQGLFGITGDGAVIRGVTLADARITGYHGTGGIVGYIYTGGTTVSDCHVATNVTIRAVSNYADGIGGIVGLNYSGTVSYCTSAATITKGNYEMTCFGGIVGGNAGTLSHNLAIGAVVPAGKNNRHGAICGYKNSGTLENNYYYGCTVAGVANATGVGCGYIDDGHGGYTTADITDNDGAVALSQAPITYVDANGKTAYCPNYTVLTGGGATTLPAGWYVVNSDIEYTGTVTLTGDVTLILADDKTMNIGTSENRITGNCITGDSYNLTIYGQSDQSGTLNAYSEFNVMKLKNYTQHGGNVAAKAGKVNIAGHISYSNAFDGNNFTMSGGIATFDGYITVGYSGGSIYFSGGNLTVSDGIYGDVSLSWTSPDDRITASSYDDRNTITIADGKSFYNGSEVLSGTITDMDKLDGKTLTPYVTVAAKQATVSGLTNYWTTMYRGDAGFSIVAEENACAYTATVSDATITLHKLGKVIPQGTAVIIVGEDDEIGMTTSTADAEYMVSNDLHGVDVATPLTTVKSTYGADAILVLSNKNSKFGFHELATTNVPARKAFLPVNDSSGARELTMVFEDVMGIRSIDNGPLTIDHSADAWYTLDGRRLSGKPMAKGVYVHSGRKVVIK